MKRLHSLRERQRFQQVRSEGKSWAGPLLVLCALPNDSETSRFGFSVSRRLGNAVQRNRARRRLREAVRRALPSIANGWDLVFIARPALSQAGFDEIEAACLTLLRRAQLLMPATS